MRVAIYVPTYQAETTVAAVIERTAAVARTMPASVLVQDDASTDATVARAEAAAGRCPDVVVEVSRNPVNLGYGGNLKRAAVVLAAQGVDVVAMVHGDLQFRPEDVPALVAPLMAGRADITLGSRVLGHPLRGGMPVYKWLGNRALTTAINLRLHARLTDPHTGLVAFTMAAAAQIDLQSCHDGHQLSADMCLRAIARGLRVQEIAIPTSYGAGSRSCSLATSVRYGLYVARALGRRPPGFVAA